MNEQSKDEKAYEHLHAALQLVAQLPYDIKSKYAVADQLLLAIEKLFGGRPPD
jgi:hypothetical protein